MLAGGGGAGLGIYTRRAGSFGFRPRRSAHWARVSLSMPGAPLFQRTMTHARHKMSLRKTLSNSAWNRRPGSALAARYSACCKARTGSPDTAGDPFAAGLAETALTGPLPTTLRTDEAAALPITAGCVVLRLNRYYGRLRRPPGQRPLPGSAGYRTPRSGDNFRRP